MNRVEMNNEMLEQVNGGSGIFDSGVTAERSRMDFSGLDFVEIDDLASVRRSGQAAVFGFV